MNCCVDNEICFLFLVLSQHWGYLLLLPGTISDGGTVHEFFAYSIRFEKKVLSYKLARLINWRDKLFTFHLKINQATRLNNIIQASRARGDGVFASPRSLASKQPSFIVWKVSWLNVNCTTPLYVAWNDDLKIFPVIIYRVVFAPVAEPSPRPESETDQYRTPQAGPALRCNQH